MAKEISGIKHKINKEFYKIYANHALKDSNNNVITATYLTTGDGKNISASIAKKEDKLTFGYNEDKIISINSSALSAGTNYIAGPNIDLTNDTISGKDWNPEIEQVEKELNDKFSGYYTKTETSGKEQLSTEFNKKQDNLSQFQLSAISSVSAKYDASGITAYYTSSQVEDRLKTSGSYLTATALDNVSGGWNEVSGKLYTSSFDSRIDEYYKKTETSSKSEIQEALNTKQNNLTNEQLSAISSVSGISSDLANNYYTKTQIDNTLNASGSYLSANALDKVSGTWNKVTEKFDSSAISAYASTDYVNQNTLLTSYSADSISLSNLTALPNNSAVIDYVAERLEETIDIAQTITDDTPITSIPNVGAITSYGYSKTQLDSILETDYYQKTETSGAKEISDALDEKQDNLTNEQLSAISSVSSISSDLKNNYYTKTEVDNKISGINVEYDKTLKTVTLFLEV